MLSSPRPHPTPPAPWLPLASPLPAPGMALTGILTVQTVVCIHHPELRLHRAALSVCHKPFQLEMQPPHL